MLYQSPASICLELDSTCLTISVGRYQQVNLIPVYPLRIRQGYLSIPYGVDRCTCLSPKESTGSSARLPIILVDTADDHRTNHDLSKSDAPDVCPIWSASRRITRTGPLSTGIGVANHEFRTMKFAVTYPKDTAQAISASILSRLEGRPRSEA